VISGEDLTSTGTKYITLVRFGPATNRMVSELKSRRSIDRLICHNPAACSFDMANY